MSGAIWLSSYPRSGNTWARMALYSLSNGGAEVDFDEIGKFAAMATSIERIDSALEVDAALMTPEEFEEYRPDAHAALYGDGGPPRLVKVHDAWIRTRGGRPLFDAAFTHATLYLIRDPRDVAISWARFMNLTIDRSIDFICAHDARLAPVGAAAGAIGQTMRSWSDHAASWIDESGLDPLVIRYEDQLADPAEALQRMAAHLGWNAPPEAIARAVEMTRFDMLAGKELHEGFRERAPNAERFFHTGKSGTWREILTPDQVARIEAVHGPMMARFGYL